MANAYSEDLRERSIGLLEQGYRVGEICALLKISQPTFYRWREQKRLTHSLKPKENWRQGHSQKITDLEAFKTFVNENAHLTSLEMANKWGNISSKTIRKMLKRIGYTRKKRLMDTWKGMSKNGKSFKKL